MIKSVKEIRTEIMQLGILRQGDRIPGVLKEWADSIVDECSSNFECEIENVGNINGEGVHEDAFTAVLVRGSINAVKSQIK